MTDRQTEILLVDDDQQIRDALAPIIRAEGYAVRLAADGREALAAVDEREPSLVVLDVRMPGMNGFDVCERLRHRYSMPILMLSVQDDHMDKVSALDRGADDYLTKPFEVSELLARIRALLRRADSRLEQPISIDGLQMDFARRVVTVDGERVPLTRTEFDILGVLASDPGRVFSSKTIIARVWDRPEDAALDADSVQLLRVHVSNLRRKLEPHPSVPRYVITEPGVGFKLAES